MRRIKLITLIVTALLLIVFVLQNTGSWKVQFLFFNFDVPMTALFLVLLLAGFVIGVIVGQRIRNKPKKNK